MKALDDPAVRKRLAHVIVWGHKDELLPRYLIEARVEKHLEKIEERISKKLKAKQS